MENWHLTAAVICAGIIGQFAINKYQAQEFKKQISKLFNQVEENKEEIIALKMKDEKYLTNKDAQEQYFRREEFKMFEKYIDDKMKTLQNGIDKILQCVESRK